MISSTVWAVGALRLTSMARMPKSRIWMVAPAAYLQAHKLFDHLGIAGAMQHNADDAPT